MNNDEFSGTGNIAIELIKYCGTALVNFMTKLVNKGLQIRKLSPEQKTSVFQ